MNSPRSDVDVFNGDFMILSGGNTFEGIITEFPAEIGGIYNTVTAAEHLIGIRKNIGVLAEFAVFFDSLVILFHNVLLFCPFGRRSHNSPVYPLYYIKNPRKNQ